MTLQAELERAAAAIDGAASLSLACHQNPDGDALGSLLAVHHLCQVRGKPSVASWPEPFSVAPHYRFLPDLELTTHPDRFPGQPEVMATFDCASLGRLGELEPAARSAGQLIVVDHHATNDRSGSINVVDPDAAATAVLVRRLVAELGWALDREAAMCLYTGLLTDTGRFQYANTTPEVFGLARELASFDLPVAAMTRQLFEEHRFAYLRLVGECLSRAELDPELGFVAAWVTADDLASYGVEVEETESLVDLVRRTAEADVSCVLKETPEGIKASLRSIADTDVAAVAGHFGGGGHRRAAGFTAQGSIQDVLAAVKAALPHGSSPPPG
ncbi:MAG: DHH family phosphoesterase [Actinomycetota bacterium]|nr:DHH family phosphoesterase [Actinomycetota bacterium]